MSDERTLSRLVVVGASHRTSSETTRDRLFISEEDLPGFLISLRKAGFTDVVALSTCARTEIFGLAPDKKVARAGAIGALATLGGFDVDEIGSQTYYHETEEALRHLFRVSASLDSPIVGEPEVTGQFRDAVRIAGGGIFWGDSWIQLFRRRTGRRKGFDPRRRLVSVPSQWRPVRYKLRAMFRAICRGCGLCW